MPPGLTLHDVHDICLARFMQRETRAEEVRRADQDAEGVRARGVSWSGLSPTSQSARTDEELCRDALAAYHRAQAFAADTRGRFLTALKNLEDLGFAKETAAARAAYARGFADPDAPACPAEIACALSALARLTQARTACLALTELLDVTLAVAAE